MPTQTFFNLPQKKRERVIAASMNEFARHSFREASVANIVEEAEIPRGSFYQYFTDLEDLYKYIFRLIAEKKLSYFNDLIFHMEEMKTFDLIRTLYAKGIEFAEKNPKLAAIGNNFFKEDLSFKRKVYGDFEEQSTAFYREIIERGKTRGEINREIDTEVASMILYYLNIFLVDYYLERYDAENLTEGLTDYLPLVDQMLHIIENGIKTSNRGEE